uniref:Uncharacterized protein n=1 Tax=Oryza sativa subsp. japonica TaxID=39947 RepID=Q6H4B3_ORYSJ|nr:hypothetical protein [Oryza sativa Japonica Group]BAD26436.1 hypothetical protein [Oryza sativa Japonica Group]
MVPPLHIIRDGAAAPTSSETEPPPPPVRHAAPIATPWSRRHHCRLLLLLDGAAGYSSSSTEPPPTPTPLLIDETPSHTAPPRRPPLPAPFDRSRSPHHSISWKPPPTRSLVRPTVPPPAALAAPPQSHLSVTWDREYHD